jgi:predicted small metal-binding protein
VATALKFLQEEAMGRKFIDCREMKSDVKCSIAIVADTTEEVVDAAALHAMAVHKHPDTPELREALRAAVKDGTPS